MDNEIYNAPETELIDDSNADTTGDMFYVVSKRKLTVMFIGTMSLYSLYWVFKNWRNYSDYIDERIMPIMRAIFQIFFMHSLFNKVDDDLKAQGKSFDWAPNMVATIYVVASVVSQLLDRLAEIEVGPQWLEFGSVLCLPILLITLLKAQDAINLSQNDPKGESNNRFTVWNILWLVPFALLWLFVGVALMDTLGVISLDALAE